MSNKKGGDCLKKQSKKIISLLLAAIMLMTVVDPVATHAAAKSSVAKVTLQPIKNGLNYWERSGSTVTTPAAGNFYYRITVNLAKSSKKTKLKLKYSHQVRPSKSGTVKLTVGKKTVRLCKFKSFPYKQRYNLDVDTATNIYLESVEIKTGKKWKKVAVTNDGVKRDGVHSEMRAYTLKKIPKGAKIRFTFNMRIAVPRRAANDP